MKHENELVFGCLDIKKLPLFMELLCEAQREANKRERKMLREIKKRRKSIHLAVNNTPCREVL